MYPYPTDREATPEEIILTNLLKVVINDTHYIRTALTRKSRRWMVGSESREKVKALSTP
jgi:hypothetical protein